MEKSSIPEVVVERLPIYIQKLNQFLREGRESVSSHEMAEALGVGQSYVSKIERGENFVDVLLYIRWCQACGVLAGSTLDRLVGGDATA